MQKPLPAFKMLFPQQSEKLPPVFQKRYGQYVYFDDSVDVRGTLNVSYSKGFAFLASALRFIGILCPYQGNNIPVTITFLSNKHSNSILVRRTFLLPGNKPYEFASQFVFLQDNIALEHVKFGLGWRMRYHYDEALKKIKMEHAGYRWRFLQYLLPLPLGWLIGKIYAEEESLSDNTFRTLMKIEHPLFGKIFEYSGEFSVVPQSM